MKMTGKLRALPDGGTEVISVSEINVVGILAQMGSRIITEVSNIMFGEFIKSFQERLQQPSEGSSETTEVKPIKAGSMAWEAAKGVFRGKS